MVSHSDIQASQRRNLNDSNWTQLASHELDQSSVVGKVIWKNQNFKQLWQL